MFRIALLASAICVATSGAWAQPVSSTNAIIPQGTGLTVGNPAGGPQGPGVINAESVLIGGVPVGGGVAIPTAPLLGGTPSAYIPVTIGTNLNLDPTTHILTATGGASPAGSTGDVQTNGGSGALAAVSRGTTGNGIIVQTTSGGLLATSILPIATTSALGAIQPDGTTITVNGSGVASAVGGSATSVVVGTTTVGGGTPSNALLFNSAGTLGGVVTLPAANQPAHTGDVTNTAGSLTMTLATVNGSPGSIGGASLIPVLTTNGKGLVTAQSTVAVVAPAGTLTGSALPSGITGSSLTSAAGGAFGTGAFAAAGLPLTGGTVSGLVNMTGINDTGGINTSAATGYSIGNIPVFNNGPNANAPTRIGQSAGASLTLGNLDTGGGFFAGYFAFATTQTGAEATGMGNQVFRYSNFVNSGNTGVGDGCGWHETTGNQLACFGADSMRNGAQNTFTVAYGRRSYEDWFGSFDNVANGTYALKGNAAAIFVTGTPRTGDVIPIIFTDANLAGGATTVNYTVLSSDTTGGNSILSQSIATAIANASLGGTLADNISADNDQVRNPGVVAITHSGNATIAGGNSGTMTVTIGTITPSGATEVLTVTNGATGDSNTMNGAFAGQCLGCSTAHGNNGTGSGVLTYMTTAQFNNCDGIGSCAVTTGHDNNVMGSNALINIVSGVSLTAGASDNELIGSKCGTTLVNDTGVHGDENIEIGDCQTGGGYITTGAANLEIGLSAKVPTITANFQMSIQNAIYGVSNSGTGTTVSTGCIGFYFTTCSSSGNGFAVDDALNMRVQTSFVLGSGSFPNMVAGEMGWVKQAAPSVGPGIISVANEIYTCGAAAGTLRKIVFGGTSNVPNIVEDNIGGGNTGCAANPPTITAGTATLDAAASDLGGTVTEGTTQTGFTLTWAGGVTKNTAPHCIVLSPNGTAFTSYSASTTTLTVVNASATADVFTYSCNQ